jgi:hypothetical protein
MGGKNHPFLFYRSLNRTEQVVDNQAYQLIEKKIIIQYELFNQLSRYI